MRPVRIEILHFCSVTRVTARTLGIPSGRACLVAARAYSPKLARILPRLHCRPRLATAHVHVGGARRRRAAGEEWGGGGGRGKARDDDSGGVRG